MSRGLRFVDADGHILEHPSGMVDYAPQRWRDRIWHIETDAEGCEWCVVNGSRTRASGMSMAGVAGMGKGFLSLSLFGLALSAPFLVLAASKRASDLLSRVGRHAPRMTLVAGVVLILLAVAL